MNKATKQALATEIGAPKLGTVRDPWGHSSVVAGLKPARLAHILKAAELGDAVDYLTLALEMEERDPHYASVIATRRLAIEGLDPVITPAGSDQKELDIAEAVERDIVRKPIFEDLISGCLDAIGKGFACVEVIWATSSVFEPIAFKHRDPRHFLFDREDAETLLLRSQDHPMGEHLEPYKWVRHIPKIRSGIPVRGGLARLAAWSFLFKNYTVKDWVGFAETYGMPLRLGKYGPEATEEDKQALLSAVMGIGSDAAAIVPQAMQIEFVQAMAGSASADVFEKLADWTDRQMSKAVLGQTMSTDEGGRGGRAQAEVHEGLRSDIRISDANRLARTINGSIIRNYVDLNYGPQESYPLLSFPADDEEDTTEWLENIERAVNLGLPVAQRDVYAKLGVNAPDPNEPLLSPSKVLPAVQPGETEIALNRSLNASQTRLERPAERLIAELETELSNSWTDQMSGIAGPILSALEAAPDETAFLALLERASKQMNGDVFARFLAEAMIRARAIGDVTD